MKIYRRIHITLAAAAVTVLGLSLFAPVRVAALSGADFKAQRIADDSVFFNSNTMNAGDIQNFLNSKVPTCDTNGTQASNHGGYATRADWGRANSAPPPYTCLRHYSQAIGSTSADAYCAGISGGTKSAADIIFNVSRACGINPQTLIVLLQKEQSLITDDWPWPIQYRSATGYGCPDTAACDSTYYGFFNQVYNAGRQFKRYIQQPGSFNYAAGRTSYVGYNPNSACGGTNLTLQTQATAALYNYTPYQPNASALANLYGSGDSCGAYGNRNFWRMFNDWFGPTLSDSYSVAVDESTNAQYLLFGGLKQAIPDPETKIAWGLQSVPIVSMTSDYLSSIPSGPQLDRLTRLNTSDQTVFFMDGGKRYRVMSQAMFDAWNFGGRPITNVPPALFFLPADGGELSYTVKNTGVTTLYAPDGASAGQTVLRPFASAAVKKAWEGDNSFYTEVSSDFFSQIDNAVGATLTSTKIINNSLEYQVVNGSRLSLVSPYGNLYPESAQAVSMATINRLPSAGSAGHMIRAASENTVYLVDNGTKHAVANPSVLAAWLPTGSGVRIVNSNYVSLIADGGSLAGYRASSGGQQYAMNSSRLIIPTGLTNAYQGLTTFAASTHLMSLFSQSGTATGFIRGSGAPELYFLDDSGRKRHIDTGDKATLMGAYTTGVTITSQALVNSMPTEVSPKIFVSDGTTEYVIEGGQKHAVTSLVKADWGLSGAQVYSDGTLSRFSTGTALASKLRDGANYFLIKGGRGFLTTDINIAGAWALSDAPQMDQALIRSQIYYYMLTRFVRSTTDSRKFVIDGGNWYNLSAAQFANLGGNGSPLMGLEPTAAPNIITDWSSVVVKDSVGKHYVIDNGTKRTMANATIQNHWTGNGSLAVPTTTNGFLNLLPNNGKVERAIKGSAPAVYSAENGTKRHVLTGAAYSQYYAPYEQVSDILLDALPTGASI